MAFIIGVLGLPAPFAQAITQNDAITYVYDDLGRLEAVVDPGQTNGIARYTYDGAGNLLSIARQSSTATTLLDFHPKLAKRDARVTIYGAGFSPTPSQNTVKFAGSSGTSATVVSSTQTQIVVEIPDSGAIGGAIFVQSPSGSVTSTQQFAEDTSGPPTISGFSPSTAVTGTAITISGTKFDPSPSRNNVFFNGIRAVVTAATATSLTVTVPPFLTSGKIAVQTSKGEATSSTDFVVPPLGDAGAPYQPAQIDSIQRLTLGTGASVAVSVGGHASMALFDATEDQRVFVDSSSFSGGQTRVKLLDPYGRLLDSTFVTATQSGYLDTAKLFSAGTYVVLVDPVSGSATGSATITVYDVPTDVQGQISADGTAVTTGSLSRGQGANYTFSGTAGQRISFLAKNSTINFGTINVRHPETWIVEDLAFGDVSTDFQDPVTLPATGTYTLQVDPTGRYTGTVTVQLWSVPADPTPPMTIGGGPITVDLLTPGQNAHPTFPGSAGQNVRLTMSNVSITNSSVRIKNPSGAVIASGSFGTSGGTLDASLGTNGTYTIDVDPLVERTGSMTLSLSLLGGSSPLTRDAELREPVPVSSANGGSEIEDLIEAYEPSGAEQWIPDAAQPIDWIVGHDASPIATLPPLEAADGITALAGQVLRLDGRPLPGATVRLRDVETITDAAGRFVLEGVRAGHWILRIDGTSVADGSYGSYEIGVDVRPRRLNILDYIVWMPLLDEEGVTPTSWPAEENMTLTNPKMPGFEVRIPAGATVVGPEGQPVDHLAITPVPLDRAPFPLPAGVNPPVYFTVQPGGLTVLGGLAKVVYPNTFNLPPGTSTDLWIYEPDEHGWETYGQGTVTADGTQIVPDPGLGVTSFDGVMAQGVPHAPPLNDVLGVDAGDPVDLATGLFDHRKTDLALPGPMPIQLTRLYRQSDTVSSYSFGLGMSQRYEQYLWWNATNYLENQLIAPGERRVHYTRISPGTQATNAVFASDPAPGPDYRSRIVRAGSGWDLSRADGGVLVFGSVEFLKEIRDRFGNRLLITGANGTSPGPITQLVSYPSGRWISLTVDGSNHVTAAKDNLGRTVTYTYEGTNRLKTVTDANQSGQPSPKPTTYTWSSVSGCSPAMVMTAITDPRNITWMSNTYSQGCRVTQQTVPTSTGTEIWDYTYTITEVRSPRPT